jgi:6,7-dimethyl-8-ribityllumazine synthase
MKTYEGRLQAESFKIRITRSRFNGLLAGLLLTGALVRDAKL